MTPEEVCAPAVVRLLKRYRVHPCLAVPHGKLGGGYAGFLHTYGAAGLEPALWPTLSDALGYWPNERNALEFSSYVYEILTWTREKRVHLPWLAVDLETPFYQWREIGAAKGLKKAFTALRLYRSNRDQARFEEAAGIYRALQDYLRSQNCRTLVPVLPFLELDLKRGAVKIQDYLETPVTPVAWDVVSVMQYNSLFAGFSKGLIRPKDAPYYLYLLCLSMKRHFGERAALSVGLTGTGKLGDEPYYREPAEMLPDIEAGLAAGIADLAVFCLEGILKSPKPEAWFEMIRGARPVIPPASKRIERVRWLAGKLYRLLP
jgi:hypothetical protein